jgi:hypothetical protein
MGVSILVMQEHSLINKNNKLKLIYKILIPLLLGVVVFSCLTENEIEQPSELSIPEIEKAFNDSPISKDSLGRYCFEGKEFSGYLTAYFDNGALAKKHGFFEGLQAGMSIGYYSNGVVEYKRPYNAGEKHGEHFGWYENGQIKFHYLFNEGLSIGNHKDWYANGKLFKDYNYKAGHPFGAQKMWRTDGKMRANFVIREDGRKYGLTGLKRCAKIDSETENIDPYLGQAQ